MRGKWKKWSQQLVIATVIIVNSGLAFLSFSGGDDDVEISEKINTEEERRPVNMTARTEQLARVCDKYSLQPDSGDFSSLHSPPAGPGVEVVLLPGDPPVTVCIPHKVGSHAWGVFSRQLADLYPARMEKLRALDWRTRAVRAKRAVIVRHPLERLVSAYRMLFQDWCDKDKFIRQRWTTICTQRGLAAQRPGESQLETLPGNSLSSVVSAVFDEFVHGQDRYISRIWYKYHPETDQDPDKMFKFSFPEFARFLVNGTKEFADDDYVLRHKGVSYHWENYWAECPVCHNLTRPDYILHLETFSEDLEHLLGDVGLSRHAHLFPHTHTQRGGHSSHLAESFLAQLSSNQLLELVEKYRLDLELFGYL